MKTNFCIFACGGRGTRMGGELPKQFLRLGGKTILQCSIERILEAEPDTHIITVLPPDWKEYWIQESAKSMPAVAQTLAKGGITRFHSVQNALEYVPSGVIVAVHDAVRPFASAELIRTLFETARKSGSAVPVVPLTDTIKVLDSKLEAIPGEKADRSILYGAQTPQVFLSDTLKAAYRQAYDTAFTDDASIVEAMGERVTYVTGERNNLKITVPDDLLFAKYLSDR